MPQTLLEFAIAMMLVVVQSVVAIVVDIILALTTSISSGGGSFLTRFDNSALYEPLFLEFIYTNEITWFNPEILDISVLEIPVIIIPLSFMLYVSVTSLRASLGLVTGRGTLEYEKIFKAGFFVLFVLIVVGIGYNSFITTVIESRSAQYAENIQWAIPSQIPGLTPRPPIYSLTRMVLRSNMKSQKDMGVKMSAMSVATITGIAGLTYLIGTFSAGGVNQFTVMIFIATMFIGRTLFMYFLVFGIIYPIIAESKLLGEAMRYAGGLVFTAVIFVPLLASFTSGRFHSTPTLISSFQSMQTRRVVDALKIMDYNSYSYLDVCLALEGPSLNCSSWLPGIGQEATDEQVTLITRRFLNILTQTFTAAIVLVIINYLQFQVLRSFIFSGYMITGMGLSAYRSAINGESINFGELSSSEYQRAVKGNGKFGRKLDSVLSPVFRATSSILNDIDESIGKRRSSQSSISTLKTLEPKETDSPEIADMKKAMLEMARAQRDEKSGVTTVPVERPQDAPESTTSATLPDYQSSLVTTEPVDSIDEPSEETEFGDIPEQ